MSVKQHTLSVQTARRGTIELTDELDKFIFSAGVKQGLCHLFLHHTSASLMICENADPEVRSDVEKFLSHIAPDGARMFSHTTEGPDDMPAHIRTLLLGAEVTIPIRDGRLALGTWQGIYLYEHRTHPHTRELTITVLF
jgi:secondary thiamine-phosphate synthase enzyme